jgi:hypothetical protein
MEVLLETGGFKVPAQRVPCGVSLEGRGLRDQWMARGIEFRAQTRRAADQVMVSVLAPKV